MLHPSAASPIYRILGAHKDKEVCRSGLRFESTRDEGCGMVVSAGMRSPEGAVSGQSAPQLPERVMMALVSTPAVFAVPSSINKGFNPPFVLRVGVVSNAPTQIKATVAAYVLQKDQVGRAA